VSCCIESNVKAKGKEFDLFGGRELILKSGDLVWGSGIKAGEGNSPCKKSIEIAPLQGCGFNDMDKSISSSGRS
jgi:hypothetical protein